MRTAKDFSTFFIFIVYGVSEGGENLLLVLLGSVDDIFNKNKKELLDEIDTLTECLTL